MVFKGKILVFLGKRGVFFSVEFEGNLLFGVFSGDYLMIWGIVICFRIFLEAA